MSRFGTRAWVGALALAVTVGLLPTAAASAATTAAGKGVDLPKLKQPPAVPVKAMTPGGTKRRGSTAGRTWSSPKVVWPATGSATVALTAAGSNSNPRRAGKLPVAIGSAPAQNRAAAQAPTKVKVTVASVEAARKAGVDGILLSVSRADGSVAGKAQVQVDYSTFRGAYGGDWAARLGLVQLPACALTTPDKPACRIGKPLATRNDTKAGTLSGAVSLPPVGKTTGGATRSASAPTGATVLAATAGDSGPTGNYKATSLPVVRLVERGRLDRRVQLVVPHRRSLGTWWTAAECLAGLQLPVRGRPHVRIEQPAELDRGRLGLGAGLHRAPLQGLQRRQDRWHQHHQGR